MTKSSIQFLNLTNLTLTIFSSKDDQTGVRYPATGLRAVNLAFGKGESVTLDGAESPIVCESKSAILDDLQVQTMGTDGKTVIATAILPASEPGVLLIVPLPVLTAAWALGRRDVIGMGNTRQQDGRPIGAEGFKYLGTPADLASFLT